MERTEAIRLMKDEAVFFSRMGFCYDPPRANTDGEQIVFNPEIESYRKIHDDFTQAGVKLHTSILHSGWVDDNCYDYRLTDRTVASMLDGHPERWYIPRVKLNAPVGWLKNHPEEVCVYFDGPRDVEHIKEMVDTLEQDWFGFESAAGYPVNGGRGFRDDRPNVNGKIALQSFASKKWLHAAGEALSRLIDHLENGPYGKQILAYQVAFGCCGETTLWGAWRSPDSNGRGDWGIASRNEFYQWIVKKYGSKEAAMSAYAMTDISPDVLPIIEPRQRVCTAQMSLEQVFYQDAPGMKDYHRFLSEMTVNAVEHFGRIVHEKTDKPAGAFYGYLVIPQAAYAGHLGIEQILESPDIDFLCSPRAYQYAGPGEPGGEQAPSRSYNRKKLWLDELDNWTHLDTRKRPGTAKTLEESLEVLEREVAKNITSQQGFWWMDLYDGWFDHPAIMDKIAELKQLADASHRTEHKSISEVLLVMDEESIGNMRVSYGLTEGLCKRLEREVKLCGAPVDLFRLKDLVDLPLEQYKVIIFLNTFCVDQTEWKLIEARIPKAATLIWNYAPGICAPEFDAQNVTALTGFSVMQAGNHSKYVYQDIPLDFPPLRVKAGDGIQPLSFDEGIVTALRRREDGGISVLAAEPCLVTATLRELFAQSGVWFYAESPCTVYADNQITWIANQGFVDKR